MDSDLFRRLENYLDFFTYGVVSDIRHYQTVKVTPTVNICYYHCKLMSVAKKRGKML